MTADPAEGDFELHRRQAIRAEAERQQRQALRDLESWARHQPPPEPGQPPADPVHLIRICLPEHPAVLLAFTRWSTCARLVSDAGDAGQAAEITDLGPWQGGDTVVIAAMIDRTLPATGT
ncbi:MAG: hypothetical protein ACRDOC_00655 [Streptosporangiaceae bacterium]